MIPPDRNRVDLDVGDNGTLLKLWYTPGAIRLLCKALEVDVPLTRVNDLLLSHMKPETLAVFVWAGRLWEDRKTALEPMVDRIDWSPRPLLELTHDVTRAVYLGLTGKDIDEEPEGGAQYPQKPAETRGNGAMPSDSPSANLVSR